jgi:hypothetical protein
MDRMSRIRIEDFKFEISNPVNPVHPCWNLLS